MQRLRLVELHAVLRRRPADLHHHRHCRFALVDEDLVRVEAETIDRDLRRLVCRRRRDGHKAGIIVRLLSDCVLQNARLERGRHLAGGDCEVLQGGVRCSTSAALRFR